MFHSETFYGGGINKMKWIKKWIVKSENGNDQYIVSLSDKNEWGCSCPVWKFKRIECKHIRDVRFNPDGYKVKEELPIQGELPIPNKGDE